MFDRLKQLWADQRRYNLLQRWKASVKATKQFYAAAFYRVFESGYYTGKANSDPVKSWEEMSRILGVEYPVSDRLKKEGKTDGKKGKELG
jgi:hypothetical protein